MSAIPITAFPKRNTKGRPQEYKDALEVAKKEYEKYKPSTSKKAGGKKYDSRQSAYEIQQAEIQEARRLEELQAEELQRLEDLRIARMEEGSEKEIATIHNEAKKKRDALDAELKKEIERLKKNDLQKWLKGGKDRKAYDWEQTTSDEEYSRMAESNLGISTRLVEIATEESNSLQRAYRSDLEAMRTYLRDYGTFEQRKLAITKEYNEKMRQATSEGQRMTLQKEMDNALRQVDTAALSAKIDWYSVFDNVGIVMKGQLEPLYQQLQSYAQTDAFRKSGADNQKAVIDAMQKLRQQLGTNSNWNDLATAMTEYQKTLKALNLAIEQNNVVTEEANRLQADYENALRKLDELTKSDGATPAQIQGAENAVQVAQAAMNDYAKTVETSNATVQDAQNAVNGARMMLSQSAIAVTNPINKITTFLQNSGIPQIGELFAAFDRLKGGIDGIKALNKLKEAGKEASDAGKDIADAGKDITNGANAVAKELNEELPKEFLDGLNAAGLIGQIVSAIMSILEILGDGIGTFISGIIDSVLQNITGILDNLLSGEFAIQIGESLVKGIGGIFKSITTMGGLFDWWGGADSDKNYEEDMEMLSLTNQELKRAIENLTDEMRDASVSEIGSLYATQMQNLQNAQANTQEQLKRSGAAYSNGFLGIGGHKSSNHKINDAMSSAEWSRVSQIVGRTITSASDFWTLTSKEMGELAKKDAQLYAKIKAHADDGYKDAAQYMDEYISYYEQLEELENQRREMLTSISFDNILDDFKSVLMDMESETEDFAENFEKMMQRAVINSFVNEIFKDKLQEWYNLWSDAVESGGELTQGEVSSLREGWNAIVADAIEQRDALAKAMGWDNSTAQQSSSRSIASMSQDTGDAIEGRLTAIQIATESIRAAEQAGAISLAKVTESVLSFLNKNNPMTQHYENVELQIAKCYMELMEINESTKAMVGPIKKMESSLSDIAKKL